LSKLGPHVIRPTLEALDWAAVAPVVKALNDTTAIRQSQRASVRVYRRYFAQQDVNRNGADVAAEVLASLGSAPATHIELFNETAQRVGEGLERHVQMTREAVDYLARVRPDLTLIAFCFSTGQPEESDWRYLREHGYGGARVIGCHAYWGNQSFTPWHALRHRTVHAWTAGDHPPFLLSEVGRDRVEGGKGGWKADGLTEDAYLAELFAYEAELMRDPYVIAATPFTGGPTPDWSAFDVDPISGRLAAVATPLPPTVPEEQPVTTPGIDVSNHQGVIDWPRVAASGVRFAGMKASGDEGIGNVYVDPTFPDNWHQSRANGLVRIAYHYARPSVVSPAASVTTFQRAIQAVGGLAAGDLVALDLEDPGVPDGVSLHVWAAEWLALAEDVFGVRPVKYSAHYYTSTHDLEHDDLARYPVWWASFQTTMPPASPGWSPIRIWQNSDKGTVPGVSGVVDTDIFLGTVEELRLLGLPAPVAVDWETPVFGPIYRGASAVGGMPDKTADDERTAQEIIRLMDVLKAAHG
jgi:GH25 family lysozyme M1 (1,4-beta-N-acetylmuramidase)